MILPLGPAELALSSPCQLCRVQPHAPIALHSLELAARAGITDWGSAHLVSCAGSSMSPESCGARVSLCRDCVCLASACRVAARFWSPGEVPGAASLCRSPALSERGGPASSCAVCSTAVQGQQHSDHEPEASAAWCYPEGTRGLQGEQGRPASSCGNLLCSARSQDR